MEKISKNEEEKKEEKKLFIKENNKTCFKLIKNCKLNLENLFFSPNLDLKTQKNKMIRKKICYNFNFSNWGEESSPVHSISESRGNPLSMTNGRKTEILVSNIRYLILQFILILILKLILIPLLGQTDTHGNCDSITDLVQRVKSVKICLFVLFLFSLHV